MKISKAEKKKILFKKKKRFIKEYKEMTAFSEPILILMRRNQKAEFYENATQGKFEFEHSDKTERYIILDTKYLQTFPYGKSTFKGYICHEDHPLPLPNEPEVTSETIGIAIDKTLNDIKKWKAQEIKAKGELIWKIAIGIAIIIGMYILYTMFAPQQTTQIVAETAKNISTNAKEVIIANATIFK